MQLSVVEKRLDRSSLSRLAQSCLLQIMKYFLSAISLGVLWGASFLPASQAETALPELLTPEQAEQIIHKRRFDKEAADKAYREAALGKMALEERTLTREDGQRVVFRRVAPAPKARIDTATDSDESSSTLVELFPEALKQEQEFLHENIHIGANVYGNKYSEIQWRDPEANLDIKVWSNIRLEYLRPISAIEANGIQYSYFGFITHYTEESEQQRIQLAADQGFEVESRWKTPPVVFSDEYYEYYVDAPWDAEIPEKLYRQLDVLFGFYLSNYERLRIQHLNAEMLQLAKEKDLAKNPPVKSKQVIMNYTPLRGEAAE